MQNLGGVALARQGLAGFCAPVWLYQFGDSLLLAIEQAPKIMAQRVHAKSKLSPNCFWQRWLVL